MRSPEILRTYQRLSDLIQENAFRLLILISSVSAGFAFIEEVSLNTLRTSKDLIFYQYAGWLTSKGVVIYGEVADVKPPGVHIVSWILAETSGGDMLLLYALSSALTLIAAIASILLGFLIVLKHTDSRKAAAVTGFSMLSMLSFISLSASGPITKVYVVLAGFSAIYLVQSARFISSGFTAAIAAAFWQLGAVFPVILIIKVLRDGKFRGLGAFILGNAFAFMSVLTVSTYWGVVPEMITHTVVVPLLVASDGGMASAGIGSLFLVGKHLIVPFSLASLGAINRFEEASSYLWLNTGIVLNLVVFGFTYEPSFTQALPLASLWALASGLYLGENLSRSLLPVILLTAVAASLIYPVYTAYQQPVEQDFPSDSDLSEQAEWIVFAPSHMLGIDGLRHRTSDAGRMINSSFWNKRYPDQCYMVNSPIENRWEKRIDNSGSDCPEFLIP